MFRHAIQVRQSRYRRISVIMFFRFNGKYTPLFHKFRTILCVSFEHGKRQLDKSHDYLIL